MKNNIYSEQTLILAKPDALQRGLVGEIIRRFENRGLKLIGLKMVKPTQDHIRIHYQATREQIEGMGNKTINALREAGIDPLEEMGTDSPEKVGHMINEWNMEYLSSHPVVALVFEGLHAVPMGRKIVGNTIPMKAEIGTIRGDFSVDSTFRANSRKRSLYNLVHASGSVPEAKREISHWFSKEELHAYNRADEHLF